LASRLMNWAAKFITMATVAWISYDKETKQQSNTRTSFKPTLGCKQPSVGSGATLVRTVIK
jgi:hypothetical protein